ncbi:alpha/beta hydrolase [Jeotgalibacillus sp. S-D1]|nr:alpha/beta hydrolase [Jeotgalibacillus sp. S-D1]
MKKWSIRIIAGLLCLIAVVFAGFYIWSEQTYQPSEELHAHVDKNDFNKEDGIITFVPDEPNGTGIVLYPGAKVEPEAYGYYAKKLMSEGYFVAIPEVLFNFALFESGKADEIREAHPSIEHWVIGGHSLGGVAAASYAYNHLQEIEGVIFLASYPSSGSDFSATEMPMLSLYAEKDGLSTLEDIEDTRQLLSNKAVLHEIIGGNHAQFGLYGEQKGDQAASISGIEQQDEMAAVTLDWLEGLR